MSSILTRLFIASLIASCSGCMQSIQQPGQTPEQVRACSTDATLANAMDICAGILAGAVTAEASIGASVQDPNTKNTMLYTGIGTGAVGGACAIVGAVSKRTYVADGCAPALAAAKQVVAWADTYRRFGELGWKPVQP